MTKAETLKVTVSIHEIKEMVQAGNTQEAINSLDKMFKVYCRLGRNIEAISCGAALHGQAVIDEAETENRIINSSSLMMHEIQLAK